MRARRGPSRGATGWLRHPRAALTQREYEIAELIGGGLSNKAIAAELSISPTTAARHVANIMAKLGFSSRTQIAAWIIGRQQEADPPVGAT